MKKLKSNVSLLTAAVALFCMGSAQAQNYTVKTLPTGQTVKVYKEGVKKPVKSKEEPQEYLYTQSVRQSTYIYSEETPAVLDAPAKVLPHQSQQEVVRPEQASEVILIDAITPPLVRLSPEDLVSAQKNEDILSKYKDKNGKLMGEIFIDKSTETDFKEPDEFLVFPKKFFSKEQERVLIKKGAQKHVGDLQYKNLTCADGIGDGFVNIYGNSTSAVIPVLFCPSGNVENLETKIDIIKSDNGESAWLTIGNQRLEVQRGYTTLYNFDIGGGNTADFSFVYVEDEVPVRK